VTSAALINLVTAAVWDGGKRLVAASTKWLSREDYVVRLAEAISRRVHCAVPPAAVREWLASPDLVADLSSSEPFDGLRLVLNRHGLTVEPDATAAIASVVVSMVAASDPQLAQRLHEANLMRVLNELNVGLGYIYEEVLTQVLVVRRALDPSERRARALEQRVYEAEDVARRQWSSLGVQADLATELASDPSVGISIQPDIGEVLLLTGSAGSGKSLCALRSHQVDLALAVLDASSPTPVRLTAADLVARSVRGVVDEAARDIGDPLDGIALVIDGLDEVPMVEARRVLIDVGSLIASRPNSRALVLSRPDVVHHDFKTQALERPDPAALESIAERIVGRAKPFYGLPPAIANAVESPLYAVATAVLLQRRQEVPQSKASIMSKLVELCIRDADLTDEGLLQSLASDELRLGVVSETAFGIDRAARAAKSRLVHRHGGRVFFSVEVYREWFAAQWCLHNGLPAEIRADNAEHAHRWLHPLALALTIGSEEQADALLTDLAEACPQLAGLVIDEATSWPGFGAISGVAAPDAARRLGAAVGVLGDVFRPALTGVPALLVTRADINIDVDQLGLWAINALGIELGDRVMRISFSEPASPWRLAHREVAKGLQRVLENKLLPTDAEIAIAEATWAVARLTADTTSLHLEPIAADDAALELERTQIDDPRLAVALTGRGGRAVQLPAPMFELVRSRLRELADSGTPVERPWPRPDNLESRSGWVDDLYTAQIAEAFQLELRRVALRLYTSLVDAYFPSWREFLPTASSMPVRVDFTFIPFEPTAGCVAESESWHPLPAGSPNVVVAAEDNRAWHFHEEVLREWKDAGRPPPPFTRTFTRRHGIVRGLFANRPATNLAYRWLLEDMERLGWLESNPRYLDRD
jgi:hypothetical protein